MTDAGVPHTPGAGWARVKAELGDMVPDLTEEDERDLDRFLGTAVQAGPSVNRELTVDRVALDDMLMQFRRQATEGCSCTVAGGPDPETPEIEEDPRCPEHGEAARHRQDSERLWQIYGQMAAAMGVDVSEPFPAVDVFADAVRRIQATEGWEREWGVEASGGGVTACGDEGGARWVADHEGGRVVSRLVGTWEPAEPGGSS